MVAVDIVVGIVVAIEGDADADLELYWSCALGPHILVGQSRIFFCQVGVIAHAPCWNGGG